MESIRPLAFGRSCGSMSILFESRTYPKPAVSFSYNISSRISSVIYVFLNFVRRLGLIIFASGSRKNLYSIRTDGDMDRADHNTGFVQGKFFFLFLLRPFVMGPPIQSKQPHSPKYTQSIFESCYSGKRHKYKENNSADDDSGLNSPFSFFLSLSRLFLSNIRIVTVPPELLRR